MSLLTTNRSIRGRLSGRGTAGRAAIAAGVAARVVGAVLAVLYAYRQDTLFLDEHFPRTWAFAAVVAAAGLITLAPLGRRFVRTGVVWAALGAGLLVFGGAALAQRPEGAGVLMAGLVAWTATFWMARMEERGRYAVLGLFLAAAGELGLTVVIAGAVAGSQL